MGRWEQGIEYEPPRYALDGTGSVDPCGDVGEGSKTLTDSPAIVEWDPYWVWTGDRCSAFGSTFEEIDSRARATLEAQTSHFIEEILWTNTVDSADYGASHPNVGLSDDDLAQSATTPNRAAITLGTIYTPNGYTSYPLATAFRDMTDALSDQLGGARGMIHVEKRVAVDLAFLGLVIQNGQRLISTLGDRGRRARHRVHRSGA
ncbi:MAG: hypothetical protein U5Q03_14940 [Bacteroidota bacterium]|nr:hypothetical protein [Bacteroidota bacterium]